MEFMEQAWLAKRPVVTNIKLLEGCPFYNDAIEVGTDEFPIWDNAKQVGFWDFIRPYRLEGACLVFDEADVFFDCTDHSQFGKACHVALKHHRKLGLDLLFIVQNVSNLYVRIRRLTNIVWGAEWTWKSAPGYQDIARFTGERFAKNLTKFRRWQFQDISMGRPVSVHDIPYREVAAKYFVDPPWYDTDQLIGEWSSKLGRA